MKIANLIFPNVNWISVNLVVALKQTLVCQCKKSHAQVPTNDNSCLSKQWLPKLVGPQEHQEKWLKMQTPRTHQDISHSVDLG